MEARSTTTAPTTAPAPFPALTIAAVATLLAYSLYRYVIEPVFVSPLARIPTAHWTCAFSPAWIVWTRFRAGNNRATYLAHRRLGPVVRLAPREVSVNCVDGGVRVVYGGGMEKARWYPDQFVSYGVVNMFSTTAHQAHSVRKRMVSNVYSKSFLHSSQQLAENSLVLVRDRFLPFLSRAAQQGRTVDVHEMNNAFAMDFMSAYLFGIASSTDFTRDHSARRHFLSTYHSRRPFDFFSQELPNLIVLTQMVGLDLVPGFVKKANQEIEAWGLKMCDAANSYLAHRPSPGSQPVVYQQLKGSMEKSYSRAEKSASADRVQLEVASEMLDHLGAGHETTAIALTYLYWEMSKHPDHQRRLREELLTVEPHLSGIATEGEGMEMERERELPCPSALDALPFLHAIIMETLRLHAPIPGIEPRMTPRGGCSLGGYADIPGGVRVSAMAYALHRNPDVFPEAESWKVERWLQPEGSTAMREMLRWFWAFGSGGRMCIGSHLAMQEMKLIVAAIYSNFRTSIVNDDGIEAIDAYTTRPRSNQLLVRFESVVPTGGPGPMR